MDELLAERERLHQKIDDAITRGDFLMACLYADQSIGVTAALMIEGYYARKTK